MAEEQKVYELVDKGPFYVMYRQTKMEDAMNVFYGQTEFHEMFNGDKAQVYDFVYNAKHPNQFIEKASDDRYGKWQIVDYDGNVTSYVVVDLDQLLAHVTSGFADPKVKQVPYSLPQSNNALMRLNKHTIQFGFGYSQAKQAFVRKKAPTEKLVIGKAPINRVMRHVASALDRYLTTEGGYSTVRITTTGSKVEMNNTVVILKRLGLKLEDCFQEYFQERIDLPGGDWKYNSGYIQRNMGWYVDTIKEEFSLSPAHQKQLKEAIQKWWDETNEKVS